MAAAKKSSKKTARKTAKKASKKVAKKAVKKAAKKSAARVANQTATATAAPAPAAQRADGLPETDLLIIDSHAMAYRAYYGLQGQNLTHPITGMPTNAVFGFFRMFFKVLQDLQPERIAVVWDPSGGSFRREVYPEYKANRKPTPDDLRPQIDEIKELLDKAGFPAIIVPNYEADDVIGSLAKRFGKKQRVVILSGDKDCYQLLNENVSMLRGSKGVTEFLTIDPAWVQNELGVSVEQITDYMGIVGDSSDNIPGAKGIGPKGASKLLQEYGTLKEIYKHVKEIKPDGLRAKLEDSKELVMLSKDLATIRTKMSEVAAIEAKSLATPDYLQADVLQMFRDEGYNAIYAELNRAAERKAKAGDVGASKTNRSQRGSEEKAGKKKAAKSSAAKGDAGEEAADAGEASAGPRLQAADPDRKYELVDTPEKLSKCLAALTKQMGKKKVLTVDTETTHQEPRPG